MISRVNLLIKSDFNGKYGQVSNNVESVRGIEILNIN